MATLVAALAGLLEMPSRTMVCANRPLARSLNSLGHSVFHAYAVEDIDPPIRPVWDEIDFSTPGWLAEGGPEGVLACVGGYSYHAHRPNHGDYFDAVVALGCSAASSHPSYWATPGDRHFRWTIEHLVRPGGVLIFDRVDLANWEDSEWIAQEEHWRSAEQLAEIYARAYELSLERVGGLDVSILRRRPVA